MWWTPSSLLNVQCQEMEATIQPASGATDTIWRLGRVQLRAPAARQSRTDIYAPKPVISHLFRQPDKRPMEALSYLFAGLAALPLLGLVFSLHQCGANVEVTASITVFAWPTPVLLFPMLRVQDYALEPASQPQISN